MTADSAYVILPTLCEAENITTLVPAILDAAPVNVIVVDDGSADGTAEIAGKIGRETGRVTVIQRGKKLGLGSAYRAGIRYALDQDAAVIVTMDADWSHNPVYLPALIASARSGKVGIGSRYTKGGVIKAWPLNRRLLSAGSKVATRFMVGSIAADMTSGYRAYPRRAFELVAPDAVKSNGYSFLVEIATRLSRAGMKFEETPIFFHDRRGGVSKISKKEIYRAMLTLARLRFEK